MVKWWRTGGGTGPAATGATTRHTEREGRERREEERRGGRVTEKERDNEMGR